MLFKCFLFFLWSACLSSVGRWDVDLFEICSIFKKWKLVVLVVGLSFGVLLLLLLHRVQSDIQLLFLVFNVIDDLAELNRLLFLTWLLRIIISLLFLFGAWFVVIDFHLDWRALLLFFTRISLYWNIQMRFLTVDLVDEPLNIFLIRLKEQRFAQGLKLSVVKGHSLLSDLLENTAEEVKRWFRDPLVYVSFTNAPSIEDVEAFEDFFDGLGILSHVLFVVRKNDIVFEFQGLLQLPVRCLKFCWFWFILNEFSSEWFFQRVCLPRCKALVDFTWLKCFVPELDGELRKLFCLYIAFCSFVFLAFGTMRNWLDSLTLLLAVSGKNVRRNMNSQVFLISLRLAVSFGEH